MAGAASRRRLVLGAVVAIALLPTVGAQEPERSAEGGEGPSAVAIQDGFESDETSWLEEETDATFVLRAHDRAGGAVREGERAERFVFEAGAGSVLYYSYAMPNIPVTGELRAQVFARSTRPGVRLYARVVLPKDRDPETGKPSFLILPGTAVDTPDRWQRLEVAALPLALERQARVLRADATRSVTLEGAYVDRLLINLYGGPGESEVVLDDLRVEPVPAELARPTTGDDPRFEPQEPRQAGAARQRFLLSGNFLTKDGEPWVPRAISAPGADIEALRRAGFDVFEVPATADAEVFRAATGLGYWLMPVLANRPDSPIDDVVAEVASFPHPEAVAFWSVGSDLGAIDDADRRRAELQHTRDLITRIRRGSGTDSRLTIGAVADQFPQYALFGRNLDIIAVEPPGIGAHYEPMEVYRGLVHKRQLAATKNPNALFWAWLPASAPGTLRRAVWGDDSPPAWGWPSAQPEQIRMLTYAALSAGYRGLGFRGDAELDRPGGLDRLYELTLLIAEIELVESILGRATDPMPQWPAFPPDPKRQLVYNPNGTSGGVGTTTRPSVRSQNAPLAEATALPTLRVTSVDVDDNRTKLLIINDFASGGQWQPPQMGYRDVNLIVPAPESAQAFEISFGDVQALESKRDAGGRRITIPIVNGTALVLLTTDMAIVERIREHVWALRPRAIDLAIKQAELRLQEAGQLNGILAASGATVRNSDDLLNEARRMVESARDALARQDYPTAWSEARSVGQPIRMVLRAQFERAAIDFQKTVAASLSRGRSGSAQPVAVVAPPVGCPPLLTCQTLPHYYYWRGFVGGMQGKFGPNRLPSGDFDATAVEMREQGWTEASHQTDGLVGTVRVANGIGADRSAALRLTASASGLPDAADFVNDDGSPNTAAYRAARRAVVDALPAVVDLPVAAVRSPAVSVRAGDFVRIRVKARLPRSVGSPSGGLIIRSTLR